MKKFLIVAFGLCLLAACGSDVSENSNGSTNVGQANTYNSQPLDNEGKPIPGIPDPKNANLTDQEPGKTPTPGIPEKGKVDITDEMKGKDIPGIPNEAERKRIIEEAQKNPNAVNTAPKEAPAGKEKSAPGPLNRPRKSGN